MTSKRKCNSLGISFSKCESQEEYLKENYLKSPELRKGSRGARLQNYAFHWTIDAGHKFCENAKLAPSTTGQ